MSDFWDFREGEEPLLRLIRTVTACTLGYRPPKPFGDCDSCPAKQCCRAITSGVLAAAKYRQKERNDQKLQNTLQDSG